MLPVRLTILAACQSSCAKLLTSLNKPNRLHSISVICPTTVLGLRRNSRPVSMSRLNSFLMVSASVVRRTNPMLYRPTSSNELQHLSKSAVLPTLRASPRSPHPVLPALASGLNRLSAMLVIPPTTLLATRQRFRLVQPPSTTTRFRHHPTYPDRVTTLTSVHPAIDRLRVSRRTAALPALPSGLSALVFRVTSRRTHCRSGRLRHRCECRT